MILIDSSVWIYYYRSAVAKELKEKVKETIERDLAAINGIIQVEVLSGISRKVDFEKVESDFKGFHFLGLDKDTYKEASMLGSYLRRKGITIPTTDLIVAATAIKAKATIYQIDSHFDIIALHTKLESENFEDYV